MDIKSADPRVVDTADKFWNLGSHEIIQELSHWQGRGVFRSNELWDRIGNMHFSYYEDLCRMAGRSAPVRSMLEWGPGGGANAVAFAGEVETFYAVDISGPNLDECIRQMDRVEFAQSKKLVPLLFDIAFPESVRSMVKEPVDFFLSTAVFQHFPSKSYGARVTQVAFDLLAPGGIALIQTREDDGSEERRAKDRDYTYNYASFTTYRPDEYSELAEAIGFKVLETRYSERLSYLYNFLQKL